MVLTFPILLWTKTYVWRPCTVWYVETIVLRMRLKGPGALDQGTSNGGRHLVREFLTAADFE